MKIQKSYSLNYRAIGLTIISVLLLAMLINSGILTAKAEGNASYTFTIIDVEILNAKYHATPLDFNVANNKVVEAVEYWRNEFGVPISVSGVGKPLIFANIASWVAFRESSSALGMNIYVVDGEEHNKFFWFTSINYDGGRGKIWEFRAMAFVYLQYYKSNKLWSDIYWMPTDWICNGAKFGIGVTLGLDICWFTHDVLGIPCVMGSGSPVHEALCGPCSQGFIENICRPMEWIY